MSNIDYTGKAPIYLKWDEKSFMYDTMYLPWQARFIYRALLQAAWHLSTRPDLPPDSNSLQNILGVPPPVWLEHEFAVRAMFQIDPITGNLFQKRLRADWAHFEKTRTTRQAAGKKGGDAVKVIAEKSREEKSTELSNSQANAKQMLNPSISSQTITSANSLDEFSDPGDMTLSPRSETPDPLSSPAAGLKPAQERQVNPDVAYLQSIAHELDWRLPYPADVQGLLNDHALPEIEAAMREYADNADDSFAEKQFFADRGGVGIILAMRRRGVKS